MKVMKTRTYVIVLLFCRPTMEMRSFRCILFKIEKRAQLLRDVSWPYKMRHDSCCCPMKIIQLVTEIYQNWRAFSYQTRGDLGVCLCRDMLLFYLLSAFTTATSTTAVHLKKTEKKRSLEGLFAMCFKVASGDCPFGYASFPSVSFALSLLFRCRSTTLSLMAWAGSHLVVSCCWSNVIAMLQR